ncbi:MAG: tetratricopeptide repeat protein [Chloroflexi bacterium]|nr:tetratricopeptide repeat protein [Chloroflexota bacterium]
MRRLWGIGIVVFCFALLGCSEEPSINNNFPQPTQNNALKATPTLAAGLLTSLPPTPLPNANGREETAIPTVTSLPTVTPLPSPSPSPQPAMRLPLAETALHNGNYAAVIENLTAARLISENYTSQQQHILYQLGVAYQADGRFPEAVETFIELLLQFQDSAPTDVHLRLGQLYFALGDLSLANAAAQFYLAQNPEMAAYVEPFLAEVHAANGEVASVIAAYEAAVSTPAQRLQEIGNRQQLAQLYLENGRLQEAITQYDAIRNLAFTQFTQGQMNYLAGIAFLAAEDTESAYGRFQIGLTQYPNAYESYLGLVELVEADVPVDDYLRGLVNFHAQSYQPAIAAFQRVIAATPDDYPADAHLYIAWSYEALGSLAEAQAALAQFAELEPAVGLFEQANLLSRTGETAVALQNYKNYLTQFPNGENGAPAAWQAAHLAEQLGDVQTAVTQYNLLGTNYPNFADAPEALFRAGLLANEAGDVQTAVQQWNQLIQTYPTSEYAGAGLVWLQRTLPTFEAAPTPTPTESEDSATAVLSSTTAQISADVQRRILSNRRVDYYWLRADSLVNEKEPFVANGRFQPPSPVAQEEAQQEAEAWLRDWLLLDETRNISQLSPSLTADFRLIVGQKLWDAGLFEAAKGEFEDLRRSVADDALLSYQLALYFRNIGLYRSSILAGTVVLNLSGQTLFEAPKFIGQLAYPVYYADLIVPLAEQYGYDPRLQFSLVRQESLFESFARSGAAAQGLSQVIPDTGAYIANQLNWPNFVNDDLYKPYVGLNFGAFYLDQQLGFFDGNAHAALAAYNGGPGNAARWYEQAGGDIDFFVETVNFPETRLYIERIFVGFVIYEYLYEN